MRDKYILTTELVTVNRLDTQYGAISDSSLGNRRYAYAG